MAFHIPEEKISEIQNVADIIDIVSDAVLLKKAGKNHIGLCPFHSEKTPSFTVNPEKQIFYCFGCQTGGSVFSFLMKHQGLTFPEAVMTVARRYGIEVPRPDLSPRQRNELSEKERLFKVNLLAMLFFEENLKRNPASNPGYRYMRKRGFTPETLSQFHIGYVPDGWEKLKQNLLRQRIPPADQLKAGLVLENSKKTNTYDRFRNRVIFPIFNAAQRVIGFGGRVMDDSLPKYLNSPETPVFNKSRSLYGMHLAKPECRRSREAILVEGYMDVMSLWQHGIRNAVATLGTSLTPEHVQLLRNHCEKVILVYDSDEAGLKAAGRSIEIFEKGHLNARILVLPKGHDPDSFLMENGEKAFRDLAGRALGVVDFLMESAIHNNGMSIEGKVRTIDDLKTYLANIGDSVLRSLYIKKLAERLEVDDTAIMEKIREAIGRRRSGVRPQVVQRQAASPSSHPAVGSALRIEQMMVTMMLQFPEMLPEVKKQNILDLFEGENYARLARLLVSSQTEGVLSTSELMTRVQNPEQEQLIASLLVESREWDEAGCRKLIQQFVLSKRKKNRDLLMKIRAAEAQNDQKTLAVLMEELRDQKKIQMRQRSVGGNDI